MARKNTTRKNEAIALTLLLGILLIGIAASGLILSFGEGFAVNENSDKKNEVKDYSKFDINNLVTQNNNDIVFCPFTTGDDTDSDGILDVCDICPLHYNPYQLDNDKDGIGNECDPKPNKAYWDDDNEGDVCNEDSDCGEDGYIDAPFCSNDNVVRTFRTYSCESDECSHSDEVRVQNNCPEDCNNGQCVDDDDDDNEPEPSPQCDDGIDNDGDRRIDFPADPGCSSRTDNNEYNAPQPSSPQCDDGIDNDGDRRIDFPADLGCSSRLDNSESN